MQEGRSVMADQKHLLVLRKGVNTWNQWREEHPEILPDLRDGNLHERPLSGIDFHRTNLDGLTSKMLILGPPILPTPAFTGPI